jgi:CubicO group peptidase (beta-lactamase class C family)
MSKGKWLNSALDYIRRWVEFQMRHYEQPGCVIAIAHRGRIVLEEAYGRADLIAGTALTPRHRFRVASHSKSFTAAGIMKLRDKDKLRLDDRAGRYVRDLHPAVAKVTIAQLLSHSAGIIRDGLDAGQWLDRRPFVDARELRRALRAPPIIEANTRFKYSNHGYGLVALVIEAVTGEPYRAWIRREIVAAAGLRETLPDVPLPAGTLFARGHSGKQPLGRRVLIPGENPTRALAAATGFVSTARDLVRYFGQLSPNAKQSVLSVASRREMVRRQWRNPHSSVERHYGLGIISGTLDGWDWFGHSGGFQGTITRTCVLPEQELTLSVLTNAADGYADVWLDGAIRILQAFARNGAPSREVRGWTGRWWTYRDAIDLVAMGSKVLVASPANFNPLMDARELEVRGKDQGWVKLAGGYENHGEAVRRVRKRRGAIAELRLGGISYIPESGIVKEMAERYEKGG